MMFAADLPYAARRLYFCTPPRDAPGGYPEFAHPLGRAGISRLHRPPYHACPFDQRNCYDPPDRWPQSFEGHPPDHREGCPDRGAGVLSASIPSPLPDRRVDSSVVAPAPYLPPVCHMSSSTFSGRPLRSRSRSRRASDISPVPSPRTRSSKLEGYREHGKRARDENSRSRSPQFNFPPRGSKSLPPSKCHRWEEERKGSKSVPTPKRHRSDEGRSPSSGGKYWYANGERGGNRDRDDGHAQDLTCPSSRDHGHRYHGHSMSNIPSDHGKQSFSAQNHSSGKLPLMRFTEISSTNTGYKSPSSPTYCCEDELGTGEGFDDDDRAENFASDLPDSASGAYEGSGDGIAGRVSNIKCEDPILKRESYDAFVDDFMDAVSANWRKPISPIAEYNEVGCQEQTKRFAELALKRYNKDKSNKVKYSLIQAIAGSVIFEDSKLYAHVNFYANAKNGPKKYDAKVLVFAELQHIGRRPNAMILKSFHILNGHKQFPGRYHHIQNSPITQDWDNRYCYACDDNIKHPEGPFYKAGHFVDTLRYTYD